MRHLSFADGLAVVDAIEAMPAAIGRVLATEPEIAKAAEQYRRGDNILYLGRQTSTSRSRSKAP